MTDQELRALVRDAVARHLSRDVPVEPVVPVVPASHPSHAVYLSIVNTGGECVIEPSVPCNHCNYCRSHGH